MAMRLQGMRVWVRPYGSEEFPRPTAVGLGSGLNVLYGQNGAGKTTILGDLVGGLSGIASRSAVEVHIDLSGPDSSEFREWLWSEVVCHAVRPLQNGTDDGETLDLLIADPLWDQVADAFFVRLGARAPVLGSEADLSELLQEPPTGSRTEDVLEITRVLMLALNARTKDDRVFEKRMANLLETFSSDEDSSSPGTEELEALATALSMSRQVCLVPRGVQDPRWDVWLTADLRSSLLRDAIAGFIAAIDRAREQMETTFAGPDDVDPAAEDALNSDLEELLRHPLFTGIMSIPFQSAGSQADYVSADGSFKFDKLDRAGLVPHELNDGLPIPVFRLATIGALRSVAVLSESDLSEVTQGLRDRVADACDAGADRSEVARVARHIGERADAFLQSFLQEPPAIGAGWLSEQSEGSISSLEWFAMERDGFNALYEEEGVAGWPVESTGGSQRDAEEIALPDGTSIALPGDVVQESRRLHAMAGRYRSQTIGIESKRTLGELSAAEGRWALLAAHLATVQPLSAEKPSFDTPHVLILDEPEAHLHRTAELNAANALQRLSRIEGLVLVAATHSPHLLDASQANVLRVHQGMVQPLTGPSLGALSQLGLTPSDLLSITRSILLVEGRHDELIINHLLADVLARTNTFVLPLHGGKNLADTIESQVLFSYTQADVIGLLDNMSAAHVTRVWEEALVKAASQGSEQAIAFIIEQMPAKKAENKFMRQWLVQAVREGEEVSRLHPWGLEREDIIEYLPPEAFVGNGASWSELRARFREERVTSNSAKRGKPFPDFKGWMTRTFGSSFDDESITSALGMMQGIPEDFRGLARLCDRIGRSAM